MSTIDSVNQQEQTPSFIPKLIKGMLILIGFLVLVIAAGLLILVSKSPLGLVTGNVVNWLLAAQSVQAMWYVTRSAGIIAYLLLWLSTVWGLAVPSKIFDSFLPRTFTFDFHQYLSLLSVGFIALHVGVLMADRYLPYTLAQILVPFLSPYRPVWVGIGVIAFYLILLVTITFYLRSRIGMKAFRGIHLLSFLGYIGGLVHSFYSGTDSVLASTQIMYAATFLVVVFLTVYWFVIMRLQKKVPARQG